MAAYLIADEIISDPAVFEEYKRAVVPLIAKFGGRFLSRGAETVLLETGKDWSPGRMVIIEFPSMAAIRDWYDSAEYAPVREIRFRSATSTLVAIDAGTAGTAS